MYHQFWSENGASMIGEVSTVNDDVNDNRFLEPLGRFSAIEEDEPARYLLCNEY
jgi:D-lyxose ketol-isomerase